MLTHKVLDYRTDLLFDIARKELLGKGNAPEVLLLLNSGGVGRMVANLSSHAFREHPGEIVEQIDDHQAVAAVHICIFQAVALAEPVPAGMRRIAPPHLRNLLMAIGHWPARDYSRARAAQIIRQGDVMDLAELDDPGVTVTSWLTDLLPQR
ncbi:hypothetical protein [Actinomadura monticuli]|uniref:Uncharacterized protein n=1 Tax=Actinomadura monticuli TaxID=3097367 RepID=A0ABV4Q686_9ACTN